MTIKAIGSTYFHFQGLSTDVKPMDVKEGATFHVIDTGEEFIFYDGAWEYDLRRIRAMQAPYIGV